MDKPDGSGPSDTRSISVRNIKSLLQVVFKIAILFIVRNWGCPVMIPDCDVPCFLSCHLISKSKNVIRILSESTSSAVSQYAFTHLFYFFFIICTKTGILHPSQFGVIEGRNIFSSSITLKTEYPASWDDTGAECACPHACTEKTLR